MATTKKRIVFLTGTRADYGKIKSLIEILRDHQLFEPFIFATGMHMNAKYGMTVDEIKKSKYQHLDTFVNHTNQDSMDVILAKTIEGFSTYVKKIRPDMIVLHGDRVETLAGAIVGVLNNILTAHIEGGELSGTVDELIRHSASKMSHVHFVSNAQARQRLVQMGENPEAIFTIGSPDVDIMISTTLPSIEFVKNYYDIPFKQYAILSFHPVTTEVDQLPAHAKNVVDAVLASKLNYVVIYPNNDSGAEHILKGYQRLEHNPRFRIFPSTRFEYFIVLMRHAQFVIGNSSSGIREAPYFGVPTVNIGTRQNNRTHNPDIINTGYPTEDIINGIEQATNRKLAPKGNHFGDGKSNQLFLETLLSASLWNIGKQKIFFDLTQDL